MDRRKSFALEGRIDHTGSSCRSADIQSLRDLFPWVTQLDVEMFLLGRMVGEECQSHTQDVCNLEHAELPREFFLQSQNHPIWSKHIRSVYACRAGV